MKYLLISHTHRTMQIVSVKWTLGDKTCIETYYLTREIIVSDDLNNAFSRQMGLTNTYVLLKRKKGTKTKSQWFLPKDNYRLSTRASAAVLTFDLAINKQCACPVLDNAETRSIVTQCISSDSMDDLNSDVTDTATISSESFVYDTSSDIKNDSSSNSLTTGYLKSQNSSIEEECFNSNYNEDYSWYQSKTTLKGFRDCKIDGRSVTDFWCCPQDFIRPL